MAFKTFEQPVGGVGPAKGARGSGGGDGGGETVLAVLRAVFSFGGTASRLEFWFISLTMLLVQATIGLAFSQLSGMTLGEDRAITSPLWIIPGLFVWWVQWATFTRRLRDRGWSNPLILALYFGSPLVTVVGLLFAQILLIPVILADLWAVIECAFLGSAET